MKSHAVQCAIGLLPSKKTGQKPSHMWWKKADSRWGSRRFVRPGYIGVNTVFSLRTKAIIPLMSRIKYPIIIKTLNTEKEKTIMTMYIWNYSSICTNIDFTGCLVSYWGFWEGSEGKQGLDFWWFWFRCWTSWEGWELWFCITFFIFDFLTMCKITNFFITKSGIFLSKPEIWKMKSSWESWISISFFFEELFFRLGH